VSRAPEVSVGLDRVREEGLKLPGRGRIGVLCNNATVDRGYRGTLEVLRQIPGVVCDRVFSPQHGFAGEKQDNMVESRHGVHSGTGLPLISLYGRTREPDPEMLAGLDALVIDLPDVGTRVYTFLSTALLCLRACARAGVRVIVLDRPNPINGVDVEGPLLEPAFASFVGLIPVPLRHGLTAGEYCRLGVAALGLSVDLEVVPARGWRRDEIFPATGQPWIMPSPNLPTFDGVLVYPGMVLLEGTNLSEGRGTTRPFELWGAPWCDPPAIRRGVEASFEDAPGAGGSFLLREVAFQPTFHKFAGETVRGFQLHVRDPRRFRPVATAGAILSAVLRRHRAEFSWKEPPYEYETETLPIDLIAGTDALRLALESGVEAREIARSWEPGESAFRETRRPFLLYAE
jgi:uncharacterized protein YbbC (DUF1343 family)